MDKNLTSQNEKPKAIGPIRWNAIIPFTLFSLVIGIYMHFFFDIHLRHTIEWVGYKAIGSEINIKDITTNFLKASFQLTKLEVTDAESPDFNSVEIGEIRFSMMWDALLRAKVVINEVAVEKISFATKRARRGKVKPPEPPSKSSDFTNQIKDEAIDYLQDEYSQNILGDIANLLKGQNSTQELEKIRDSLPSKAKLEVLEKNFKAQQIEWDKKFKALPQSSEIKSLGDRLSKVKINDFKSPQEVAESVQQFETIFKEADAKFKLIQSSSDDLKKDIDQIQTQLNDLNNQIKVDLQTIEARFRIPKIDPSTLSKALFYKYLGPYLGKVSHYKSMAYKYIPPKLIEKNKSKPEEELIQPHPRESGISYEFGRPGSYPLFWLKKTSISSKAGSTQGAGNVDGLITDITSNQKLIHRPTVLDISGGFPDKQINDFQVRITLDNTQDKSLINYLFKVGSYPIDKTNLIESGDVNLTMEKAIGHLSMKGSLAGFQEFQLNLNNEFKNLEYNINAKESSIELILKNIFKDIHSAHVIAAAHGSLPKLNLSITSDLGELLEKGFNKELQTKIQELKSKVKNAIEEAVGKQKNEIEKQFNQTKSQIESEIKKIQDQVSSQKKLAESKEQEVKKEAESQGRKQIETEGKKKLDELKKKFGF